MTEGKPEPHIRKLGKWEGYGYIVDKNPELTREEALEIECEDLREAARLPLEIIENIGKHMSMAQHPLREIEKAAIVIIDGDGALVETMRGALEQLGCQGECEDYVGYCCVCEALTAYEAAQ